MKSSILSALVMGVILTTVAWGNDARSTQTTNSQAAALPPGCDLGKISQASLALAQNQNTYLAEVVDQMQNVQQEFTQLDSWQSSNAGRTLQYDGVFAQEAQVAAGLVTWIS